MSLLGVVVILVIIGILLYLINQYVPMDTKIRKILNVVVVMAVVIWVLGIFLGGWHGIESIRIGN